MKFSIVQDIEQKLLTAQCMLEMWVTGSGLALHIQCLGSDSGHYTQTTQSNELDSYNLHMGSTNEQLYTKIAYKGCKLLDV